MYVIIHITALQHTAEHFFVFPHMSREFFL